VGIGVGTVGVGTAVMAGAIISGSAGGPVTAYSAGGGFITGLTIWSLGWGDIANGLSGNKSYLYEHLKTLYSPGLEDAINPF
jgi:hypothetical protein